VRAAVVALVIAIASVASGAPSDDFAKGRQYFKAKDYGSAQPILNDLVHPKARLASSDDLVECYIMLGTARVENGDRDGAKAEFAAALQLQPDKVLVVNGYYSETAVRVFDETKDDLRRAREDDDRRKAEARRQADFDAYVKSLIVYENHPYYVNFVPLGVPQFQGKRPLRGTILAVGQAVTLGTSVSTWLYLSTKYGFPNGKVPTAEVESARNFQQLEIGAGIAFFGLYAWGVYDSITHYQAQTRVKADPDLLPPGLRPQTKTPAPSKTSFRLIPLLVPNGAGIGLTWEN
jgi:hypothetical protein